MQIRGALVVLLLTSAVLQSPAQSGSPDFQRASERHTATSSLEFKVVGGKEHTVTNNQRFSVIYRCLDDCAEIVLQESFYSDQEEGVEGARATVNVTAWRKDTPNKGFWKLRASGDSGKPLDAFYEITQFGCCGGWDDNTYYSLRTGKKIFTSSSDFQNELLEIEVPNTPTKRYLTYSRPVFGKPLGSLQFGNAEAVQQTVTISEPILGRPPTVALRLAGKPDSRSVTLWSHDYDRSDKAVSDVSVVLGYEDSGDLIIPIENDRLAVQKVKAPKGYTVKE